MLLKPHFRDSPEFQQGRTAERLVARFLQEKGWFVVPSYDYSGEENNKAPRLQGLEIGYVIPDLDIAKDGRRLWAEVKWKSHPEWTRCTQRWEHGINARHWREYQTVQRITGCEVWLFIVEGNTRLIWTNSINRLAKVIRAYTGSKMGADGMVFFPRNSFVLFANYELTE